MVKALLLGVLASMPVRALEVGAVAPPLEGTGLVDKKPVSLAALRGRVVLVDFWASWCGPCKISLPEMNTLRQDLAAMGYGARFEVIAVNVDENTQNALKFLSRHPVAYPLVSDPEGRLPASYQLPTMPSSYLVGTDGRIVQVHSGYKPGDAGKLKADILRLLGALLLSLLALCSLGGCVTVQPWQRGELAQASMSWDPDPQRAALASHVYFSKEASSGGAGLGGGGCGCN